MFQCHLHPIWTPVTPLNLPYILIFLPHHPEQTCPIYTSNILGTKSHVHFLALMSFIQRIYPGLRLLVNFLKKLIFYDEDLVPSPTPKLVDHPLSVVRDCLFNIFAATLHIWRLSPPSATWGHTMPLWQGTNLTWLYNYNSWNMENVVKKQYLSPCHMQVKIYIEALKWILKQIHSWKCFKFHKCKLYTWFITAKSVEYFFIMWKPPTWIEALAIHRVADYIC
jgi:hypothetical protein